METFHTYNIRFIRRGETKTRVRQFQATNAGSAFSKCVRKYPGCRLLEAWREARLIRIGGDYCRLVYALASTARIVAEPAPKEEQILFSFLEEISLSPKKRDRDATSSILQPNSSHIGEHYHDSINRWIDARH
jgi:hypothetical protein